MDNQTSYTEAEENFFQYYAEQSVSPSAIQRFNSIRTVVENLRNLSNNDDESLDVADIGCNAGTQCIMWARDGHRVHGLDVNQMLLELAEKRTGEESLEVDYRLGSAIDLPWENESMDICLVPELLEHVADWRSCLDEFCRILRPNGILYLSTTNYLCPLQQEFDLPLYSWYPGILKHRYERLAMSSRPELANYAKYPAVNWFTFYSLRAELDYRGLDSYDRFDSVETKDKSSLALTLLNIVRSVPPLRFLAHVATPYTVVLARKR